MSHVTDIILMYGHADSDYNEKALFDEINGCVSSGKFVHVDDASDEPGWYGGGNYFNANVALGVFVDLDIAELIQRLKEDIDYSFYDVDFVQVMIQDEHNNGFSMITVFESPCFDPYTTRDLS